MNGNCHFMFGTAVGFFIAVNLNMIAEYLPAISDTPEMRTLFVLGGMTGGVLPDIDCPNSYIGKLTVPVSTLIGRLQKKSGKTKYRHRGLFHDPTVYLIGLYLSYNNYPALAGLFTGCLTHIFLDLFNPAGVPFLFGAKHLRIAKFNSGSRESIIFTWIITAIVLITGLAVQIL